MIFLNLMVLLSVVLAKLVQETLVISRGIAAPDCLEMDNLLLVNNSFTGPPIKVAENDDLDLLILNSQNETISIHIHGIFQRGSNEMDGASFISNRPINPMDSTRIKTRVTGQSGTYFYHAHLGLLDLHVYGAFIVTSASVDEQKVVGYDEDRIFLLSDYWRAVPDTLLDGLINTDPFKFVGSPQAFLTNGKTIGANCSASSTPSYDLTTVDFGKSYRFRLIGASTLFPVHFSIPGHSMTLVEVDETLIKPIQVDYVEILPGQRYSIIVKANQTPGRYWMQQIGKWRSNPPTNGFSILQYNQYTTSQSLQPPSLQPTANETVGWINSQFTPLISTEPPMPIQADTLLVLEGKQITWHPASKLRWTVNNISYIFPSLPILDHAKSGTLSTLPPESAPYTFALDATVDIVFQNTVALNGVCEVHPWHIHGHAFWLISSGPGTFSSNDTLTFPDPIKRDTVSVYPDTFVADKTRYGRGCGWSKVRVVMDNPGAWALHCHIASHYAMGMGTAFVVDAEGLAGVKYRELGVVYSSTRSSSSIGIVAASVVAVLSFLI